MPELDEYRISELDPALNLNENDIMEIASVDQSSETGYRSHKTPLTQLGAFFNTILQYVTSLKTGNKTVTGAINQTISNFANDYDATATYEVGDCVLYAGVLYKCTTAIPTAEEWDATHWTVVKAVDMGGGGGGASSADQVSFDDTGVLYSADNVQEAIEEVSHNTCAFGQVNGSICLLTTPNIIPLLKCLSDVASGSTGINLFVRGKNFFNKNDITTGKYIDMNGIIQDSSNGFISNYIPVKPSTKYYETQWFDSDVSRYVGFYTANKAYISVLKPTFSGGTFTTPANAAYIRVSAQNTYLNSLMLVLGETAPSEYVAYAGVNYTVDFGETLSGAGTFDFVSGILTRSDTTTKQLTPTVIFTLSGENYIFADTGDTSIEYVAQYTSAKTVRVDDTNLAYVAKDVQTAFEKITKTLTWEEYQALSSEEKNNGTIYLVSDVNAEGQDNFQPIIYSENEREIGVWSDGKPLYEKTLSKTTTYTKNAWVEISDLSTIGIDKIVNSSSSLIYTFDNVVYRVDSAYFYTQFNKTTGKLNGQQKVSSSLDIAGTGIITIQYTKTADTAGSGTWTPQAVPAHHYSTDEQVIGTWIDGSTIYEKTFVFSSTLSCTSNAWTNTDISSSNIGRIVSVSCFTNSGSLFDFIGANRDSTNYVQLFNVRSSAIPVDIVTLRYTKTS